MLAGSRRSHRLVLLLLFTAFVACAPFGPDFGQGGGSSSFSSVGTPVPQSAADGQAKAELTNALSAAMVMSIGGDGGFAGFTPAAAPGSTHPWTSSATVRRASA